MARGYAEAEILAGIRTGDIEGQISAPRSLTNADVPSAYRYRVVIEYSRAGGPASESVVTIDRDAPLTADELRASVSETFAEWRSEGQRRYDRLLTRQVERSQRVISVERGIPQ